MINRSPLVNDTDFADSQPPTLVVPDLVMENMMIPHLNADSKISAIKTLVDRLHQAGALNDSLSFLQSILARENLESTVIDGVIALPHARNRSVNRLAMTIGLSQEPIDYPSGDDRHLIRAICTIAVPMDAPRQYIGLLATLATTFSDRDFVHKLFTANSASRMCELMHTYFALKDS